MWVDDCHLSDQRTSGALVDIINHQTTHTGVKIMKVFSSALMADVINKSGGAEAFNSICQAVMSGSSVSDFKEFKASGSTRALFNQHRLELLEAIDLLAKDSKKSTTDYIKDLAKKIDWLKESDMVSGFDMLKQDYKWHCAFSDPYVDRFETAIILIVQYFICIDVITNQIKLTDLA